MRLKFGLRAFLLFISVIVVFVALAPIARKQWEYYQVLRERPEGYVSLKYNYIPDGARLTMLANKVPIQNFSIEIRDEQNKIYFDSGNISVESCHTLIFDVKIKTSDIQAQGTAEPLLIVLPEKLLGKNYHLSTGMAYLGYHHFETSIPILSVFDELNNSYELWVLFKP